MNMLLEIINVTLVAVAKSVFNFWFLIIIWLVYFLIKKYNNANIYNIENSRAAIVLMIEAALQGTVVGIIGSFLIIFLGLPLNITVYIIFLLPISLVLSIINVRYICFSYSAAIMGLLALLFKGQEFFGMKLPTIDINITGLMALVGILHLMESILIYFVGADDCIPIISKKNNQIILGHILQKYWPVPIAILVFASGTATESAIQMPNWWPLVKGHAILAAPLYYGLTSIVGALGYSSITFTEEPERRAKKTAVMLFGYSLIIISIAIIAENNIFMQLFGLVLMASIHEAIILIELRQESRNQPVFTLPEKGIRIMYVIEGSAAFKMGMKRGDIIRKINDIEVINLNQFKMLMKNKFTFLWIETMNLKNEIITYEFKAYPEGLQALGIKVIPERPRIIFKQSHLRRVGMIHLIKNKYIHK